MFWGHPGSIETFKKPLGKPGSRRSHHRSHDFWPNDPFFRPYLASLYQSLLGLHIGQDHHHHLALLKRHWRRTFIETNTQTSCHDQLTTKIYKPNAQQRLHPTGLCASRTPKTNCSWMLGIYKENVSYSVYLMNAVPPNQHHVLSKFRPASVMTKICPPGTWTSAVKSKRQIGEKSVWICKAQYWGKKKPSPGPNKRSIQERILIAE